PTAPMRRGHHLAVEGQQCVGVPAGLKDGFVHGPTARFPVRAPHLQIIDPLQRLIRTQYQSRHIPADVFKPLLPAKQRAIRGHPLANRLWYPYDRQHARLPWSRFALLLLSSSISSYGAITFQVVFMTPFWHAASCASHGVCASSLSPTVRLATTCDDKGNGYRGKLRLGVLQRP